MWALSQLLPLTLLVLLESPPFLWRQRQCLFWGVLSSLVLHKHDVPVERGAKEMEGAAVPAAIVQQQLTMALTFMEY